MLVITPQKHKIAPGGGRVEGKFCFLQCEGVARLDASASVLGAPTSGDTSPSSHFLEDTLPSFYKLPDISS